MNYVFIIILTIITLSCSHSDQPPSTLRKADLDLGSQPFKQPRPLSQGLTPFRFAVISDLNGSYGSKLYSKDVSNAVEYIRDKKNKIDFVISTGDMVAGQKSHLDYDGMWKSFHGVVTQPILNKNKPLFPSPGNHDAYLSRSEERAHYRTSWLKQNSLAPAKNFQFVENVAQNFPFQYAFIINGALFIGLDDTAAQQWSVETINWLKNVLKQESDRPLKFVFGHVPLLPFAFHKEKEYVARGVEFLESVEKLFEQYKVNAFMSGHSHVYYPGRRDHFTEYISVPLLGSGARYLINRQKGDRSQKAFLVVDVNQHGDWKMSHIAASDYNVIKDSEFPEALVMPDVDSSLCNGCSGFPKTHFLDFKKRILYRRSDLVF